MITDPVCGEDVDPRRAEAHTTYEGKSYVFCSASCKEQFERAPAYYTQHPAPLRGQTVTVRGVTVIARDDDIRVQGVDVVTAHPHTMTRGTDVIESPREGTISRGTDVIEATEPSGDPD